MRKHTLSLLLALPLLINSCGNKENTAIAPAYLYFPNYTFKADSTTQGASTSNVSDVWIYAGGDARGAYELPALLPVLQNGTKRLLIQAGIKANGISTTRVPYGLYEPIVIENYDFKPGKIDTLRPEFRYNRYAKFLLVEGFENLTKAFKPRTLNNVPLRYTSQKDSVISGHYSLKFSLTGNRDTVNVYTIDPLPFKTGVNGYLEIDYRNNVNFEVGVLSYSQGSNSAVQIPLVGINPRPEGNKIYINVADVFTNYAGLNEKLQIYIFAVNRENKPDGFIILDNIKAITLE